MTKAISKVPALSTSRTHTVGLVRIGVNPWLPPWRTMSFQRGLVAALTGHTAQTDCATDSALCLGPDPRHAARADRFAQAVNSI